MDKKLLRENFYEAVNKSWLENAVIPSDQPSISAFMELHLDIEKTLVELANKWEKDSSNLNNNLKKFVKLYKMAKNFEKREELGTKPIKVVLDKIDNIKTLEDLQNSYRDLSFSSINLPFMYVVMQDFMNSNNQVLYFAGARTFLPDTSYYKDEATKQQLIGLFTATRTQLLTLYGYSQEEAAKLINEALAFDALLVPVTKSSIEAADYVKMYNPVSKKDVENKVKNIKIMNIAEQLVEADVKELIFTNLDFIESFDSIFNEENFEIIKSWIILTNLIGFSSELTEELRVSGGAFMRALSGIAEARPKEKEAFYHAYNSFDQVVGLYYGENYFGPVARENVRQMVYEMMEVYKQRIKDNNWLEEKTKEKAIKKVDSLGVHVGYPDELPKYYDLIEVGSYEENSNLLIEAIKINELIIKDSFSKYNKEPNKNLWQMPASMVNAYYSPQNNQIVFPAAILQKPYYSLEQTASENYGGIGAVMAHEISHAFDNNGAKFDETGSLSNWWSENDLKAFDEKKIEMIKLFDGLETGYGKCNGELTVSENIADSGGLRAALEASKKQSSHSYDEFFQNWARVWRQKASEQYSQLLLTVDVHGPAILRANMQLSNLVEFQDYYKIDKNDKMYLPKDKMVSIW